MLQIWIRSDANLILRIRIQTNIKDGWFLVFNNWAKRFCRWNRNRIRKYFSLLIMGPDGFESWKNGGWKSCDTLPLYENNILRPSNRWLSTLYVRRQSEKYSVSLKNTLSVGENTPSVWDIICQSKKYSVTQRNILLVFEILH